MHGLTGGSWKRNHDQAMVTGKNDPMGNHVVWMASRPTADCGHRASSRPSTNGAVRSVIKQVTSVSELGRWALSGVLVVGVRAALLR
jgi:hypothetical protein